MTRYEKVVTALNVQLDDLRGQLVSVRAKANEPGGRSQSLTMQSLMDTLYEGQGEALLNAQEGQTQAESYVTELRARVGKLTKRTSSGEVSDNLWLLKRRTRH